MNKYVGKSLICDTRKRDGHVFFYEDYFEFVAKDGSSKYNFKINYSDVIKTFIVSGIKKRVDVTTSNNVYSFYLYKANTLVDAINVGKDGDDIIDMDFTSKEVASTPLSEDDIKKLKDLKELFDQGVIDETRYNKEKDAILNK